MDEAGIKGLSALPLEDSTGMHTLSPALPWALKMLQGVSGSCTCIKARVITSPEIHCSMTRWMKLPNWVYSSRVLPLLFPWSCPTHSRICLKEGAPWELRHGKEITELNFPHLDLHCRVTKLSSDKCLQCASNSSVPCSPPSWTHVIIHHSFIHSAHYQWVCAIGWQSTKDADNYMALMHNTGNKKKTFEKQVGEGINLLKSGYLCCTAALLA